MKDKIVLITGANRGIGFETAMALAKMGAHVLLVGRDLPALEKAKDLIASETNLNQATIYPCDLSSPAYIRQLSESIHSNYSKIDVLINNAGAVFTKFERNDIGLEKTIAVNHFAYFLLTYLLMDILKKSDEARIINVASDSHFQGKIDFESFTQNKNHFVLKAYEQSKLANVLFTYNLAEKLKGTSICVNALHPGRVKTAIGNKNQPFYLSLFWSIFTYLTAVSVKKGAETSIFLASSETLNGITGKYFADSRPKISSKSSYDRQLAENLWTYSEKALGINFL